MIRNRADEELACRKVNSGGDGKPAAAASSRPWSAQAESRIVRVSRVFGGKDRHSKVRTVKGLRDRRVRLSVPTAIQLYDLQDRLGLNQPSKVVDWLLNAAQHEIDKLPPLQFPPQDLLGHLPSPMPASDIATAVTSASATAKCDGVCNDGEEAHLGLFPASAYRIMSLNNSLGLVNGAMPLGHHGSYCPGESWNNSSNNSAHEANCSPPVVAHHHSSFPSLLSLAPGSQLVFYSSDGGQFPVDNVNSQSLSLSSARTFHQSGSHG